ncbi:MAG: sulfotransferase domain-containing protein [Promethearchaeota archaeon]
MSKDYLKSIFTKITQCHFETIPFEYSILIKLYLRTNIKFKNLIKLKKKDYNSGTISYKGQIIDIKSILTEEELNYLEDNVENLLKKEYIFDSSKYRKILEYNIVTYCNKLLKFKKIQGLSLGNHPDVIVLGSPKCATTWFYNICKKFKFIDVAIKEPEFFSSINYCRGVKWYKSLFNTSNKIKMDISVGYFDSIRALKRINQYQKDYNLNLKFLLFVRKPSSRVNSYINYREATGRGWYNKKKYLNSGHVYNNFIKTSYYLYRIHILEQLFDNEKIFVVFYEDLFKNPKSIFKQILKFINPELNNRDIEDMDVNIFKKKYNKGKKIFLFPLFKFLFYIDKAITANYRYKKKSSIFKRFLVFLIRNFRAKLIYDSKRPRKNYVGPLRANKILEINKKYENLKNELKNRKINFSIA